MIQQATVRKKVKWNKTKVKAEAKKYSTVREFKTNAPKAYIYAYREKIVEEVCNHMFRKKKHSLSQLKREAKKYKFRNDFRLGSTSMYVSATRRGLLDEVCAHMLPKRRKREIK